MDSSWRAPKGRSTPATTSPRCPVAFLNCGQARPDNSGCDNHFPASVGMATCSGLMCAVPASRPRCSFARGSSDFTPWTAARSKAKAFVTAASTSLQGCVHLGRILNSCLRSRPLQSEPRLSSTEASAGQEKKSKRPSRPSSRSSKTTMMKILSPKCGHHSAETSLRF